MTPERITELRSIALHDKDIGDGMLISVSTAVPCGELLDLLATAESVAKLREAIETAIEDLIDGDAFVIDRLRAALESDSKGGEHD